MSRVLEANIKCMGDSPYGVKSKQFGGIHIFDILTKSGGLWPPRPSAPTH